MSTTKLEDIVSLAKRRGFIYPGSDVYGGLSGTWDYGPLGVALKRNIMQLWWTMFVDERDDMYGVDAAILMNQKVWKASGHVDTFSDPMIECMSCLKVYRADKLLNEANYKDFLDKLTYEFVKAHQDIAVDEPAVKDLKNRLNDNVQDSIHVIALNNITSLPEWEDLGKIRDLILKARIYQGPITKIYLEANGVRCENCGKIEWGEPHHINMMFKTVVGPKFTSVDRKSAAGMRAHIEWLNETGEPEAKFDLEDQHNELGGFMLYDSSSISYLRPETAQGIFTNFKNVVDSFYPDMPFGLAQQGKAFRNEISPRDFIFRSREFEQMEIEYFVHPDNWEEEFNNWVEHIKAWCRALGLNPDPGTGQNVFELPVEAADRAHYSDRTIDFEFDFPIGREELLGLAYRTDFDLQNIQRESGKGMEYRPKDGGAAFVPHVIEPSFGVERALMAVLTSAYTEDEVNGEKRTYLRLPEHLAPVKYAVSPLLKNKPELVAKAKEVYGLLKKKYGAVMWDDNGNIGKRYRRQDEIGTPYCVVIDFETLEGDGTVTIRSRDTTEQKRISVDELLR